MFTISRKSPFNRKVVNTMELPMTEAEFLAAHRAWSIGGVLIQDAFPMLTPAQREFIKTGITPDEWDAMFGGQE